MGILFKNLEEEVLSKPNRREPLMPPPPPAAALAPPVLVAKPRPAYSIDDAMALMRSLPLEQNQDIVVRVVRSVWTTMRVSVGEIIADADRREKDLSAKASTLAEQVRELEAQVATRREQMRLLESELREVTVTRELLAHADAPEQAEESIEGLEEPRAAEPPPMPSSMRARITREEPVADPSAQPTVLLSNNRLTAAPSAPRR